MKYFKAIIITTVDHEKGKTASFIYLASEKIAVKRQASEYIFKTDGTNCCFYKLPRLEEISVEEYLVNTKKIDGYYGRTGNRPVLRFACDIWCSGGIQRRRNSRCG